MIANYEEVIKNVNLDEVYRKRREKVYDYMAQNNISVAVFEDSEDSRCSSLRYLTGHPSDAVLLLSAERTSILIPWDENLANERAHADKLIPYTKYGRDNIKAVEETLKEFNISDNPVLALSPETTYPLFNKYKTTLPNSWKILCKEDSVHHFVIKQRSRKDEYEIACTKKACSITSAMTDIIVQGVKDGKFTTESEVALFIEGELRKQGCERTSFDTLAAGPSRSYAIHAFPGYTAKEWGTKGLSILDYGVCYEGYASDCTITIARGPLTAEQTRQLDLVQKAADECIKLYKPSQPILAAATKADDIFAEDGRTMPHGLGHGTGLDIHEAPFINRRAKALDVFEAGNIITLEPGLYDPIIGGCRLENDVLITEDGNEILTNSKIFRL